MKTSEYRNLQDNLTVLMGGLDAKGYTSKEKEGAKKFALAVKSMIHNMYGQQEKNGQTQAKVYVCSAYAGDVEYNTVLARCYCDCIISSGAIPICPHIYFTQFLDDNIPESREMGMQMGLQLLAECDSMYVFIKQDGIISEGMRREITYATAYNIPIHYIDWEKFTLECDPPKRQN